MTTGLQWIGRETAARIQQLRHSIAGRIVLIMAALVAPLIALLLGALWSVSNANIEARRASLLFTARALAAGVDAQIESYITLASALAASPALLADDLSAFDIEARRVIAHSPNPSVWVRVADLQGNQLVNTRKPFGTELAARNPKGREVEERAIASGQAEVSNIYFSQLTGSWTASIAIAAPRGAAPARVLSIVTALGEFEALVSAQNPPRGWLVGILDREGKFVARIPNNAENVGRPGSAGFRASMQHEGVSEFRSLEGDTVINASIRSALSGWTVGIGVRKDVLLAADWLAIKWAIALAVALTLIGLALAWILTQRIVATIAQLQEQSNALIDDRPAAFHSSIAEIAEMWSSLQGAVAARNMAAAQGQAAQIKQRESEAQLRLALDAARLGLWQYDLGDGTVTWDERFKVIFDVKDSAAHLDGIIERLVPEDIPRVREALAAAAAPDNTEPYIVQYRIRMSDGAIRWIEAHGQADFEGTGSERRAVRLVGTVADITQGKEHEQHTQLLMHEVVHRSKNVLAVVLSIARLTAKSGRGDYATRLTERIQALASSQDLIVSGNWKTVDLGQLVRSQLAHFKDMIDSRIVVEGAPVNITPAAAQTLGMTLHELATNASKYGALSTATGRVTIRWRVIPVAGGEDTFEISWIERNGPPVTPPERRGFGTTVVEGMAKSGLRANVRLEYPPEGMEWHLVCAAAVVRVDERSAAKRVFSPHAS